MANNSFTTKKEFVHYFSHILIIIKVNYSYKVIIYIYNRDIMKHIHKKKQNPLRYSVCLYLLV